MGGGLRMLACGVCNAVLELLNMCSECEMCLEKVTECAVCVGVCAEGYRVRAMCALSVNGC